MLSLLFFVTALLYASVGFGGGSSYIALLFLFDTPYALIPIIALACNITVVSGSSFHYVKAGYLNLKLAWPLCIASVPMAYIGGRIPVDENIFSGLLCVVLFLSGIQLLRKQVLTHKDSCQLRARKLNATALMLTGGILGLVAGITGIGGGIFLAPALYFFTAEKPRSIACTAAVFILVNSLAGAAGQLQKSESDQLLQELINYWHLPFAVLIGGQLGNLAVIKILRTKAIAILTAILILFVSVRLALSFI